MKPSSPPVDLAIATGDAVGAVQSGAAVTSICSVVVALNAAAVRPIAGPPTPTASRSASGRLGRCAIWLSLLVRPPYAHDLPGPPEEGRDDEEQQPAARRPREDHQEACVRHPVFDAADAPACRSAPMLDAAVRVAARHEVDVVTPHAHADDAVRHDHVAAAGIVERDDVAHARG